MKKEIKSIRVKLVNQKQVKKLNLCNRSLWKSKAMQWNRTTVTIKTCNSKKCFKHKVKI